MLDFFINIVVTNVVLCVITGGINVCIAAMSSNEDRRHLVDELDKLGSGNTPLWRTVLWVTFIFLFPPYWIGVTIITIGCILHDPTVHGVLNGCAMIRRVTGRLPNNYTYTYNLDETKGRRVFIGTITEKANKDA